MQQEATGQLREYRDDIRQAVEVMNQGGIILYPTDTIWGIGCDATNPEAVKRVFSIKHRNDAKALITLIDSEAKLRRADIPTASKKAVSAQRYREDSDFLFLEREGSFKKTPPKFIIG